MSFLNKILLILNLLWGLLLALAFIGPTVDPSISAIPSILGALFPILLIGHIFFILYWMLNRWQWSLISILLLLAGWKHIYSFVGHNPVSKSPADIRVASFNLFGLREHNLGDANKKQKIEGELKQVLKTSPDVLCLQENNSYSSKVLEKVGLGKLTHNYTKGGVKLLTKFPIQDQGSFDLQSSINSCLWAEIRIHNSPVRVYCMHLRSNRVSTKAEDLVNEGVLSEKEAWTGVRTILGRYKEGAIKRKSQANKIKAHADNCTYPVVMMGDINDHPLSYAFGILSEKMKDSFYERGRGIGTTYGGSIPLLRIDYILASEQVNVLNHDILKTTASDHYFVSSDVSFNGK